MLDHRIADGSFVKFIHGGIEAMQPAADFGLVKIGFVFERGRMQLNKQVK